MLAFFIGVLIFTVVAGVFLYFKYGKTSSTDDEETMKWRRFGVLMFFGLGSVLMITVAFEYLIPGWLELTIFLLVIVAYVYLLVRMRPLRPKKTIVKIEDDVSIDLHEEATSSTDKLTFIAYVMALIVLASAIGLVVFLMIYYGDSNDSESLSLMLLLLVGMFAVFLFCLIGPRMKGEVTTDRG